MKKIYSIVAKNQVKGTIDVMYYGLSKKRALVLSEQIKKAGAESVKIIND